MLSAEEPTTTIGTTHNIATSLTPTAPGPKLTRPQKCYLCHTLIANSKSICSQCRAVVYCSRDCQISDWKSGGPRIENGRPVYFTPHKVICPKLKQWMEREKENVLLREYFPWLKGTGGGGQPFPLVETLRESGVEVEGTGREKGYWNVTAHVCSHELSFRQLVEKKRRELLEDGRDGGEAEKIVEKEVGVYQPGLMLLGEQFPGDEAWGLEEGLFPHLPDSDGIKAVPNPLDGTLIASWQQYYEWRNIPPRSIAVMLLHMPLTIYRMVTKFPHLLADTSEPLNIHLLGPERELDIVPLFAELLFLLPHHNINITMIGPTAFKLRQSLREMETAKPALLTKYPLFTYTHPTTPSRKINIHIDTTTEFYQNHPTFTNPSPSTHPSIVCALNAGLSTYPTWPEILTHCLTQQIPFACTEYCEQSVEYYYGRVIIPVLNEHNQKARGRRMGLDDVRTEFNAFRQPGAKGNEFTRCPDHVDGFLTWFWSGP
ncbi:hypothetical protein HK097_000670 [Rhizophlyctis rosea]|uniref:MYND-type domain-containing protein n=1 Tax=Rhizophlyctis rosea TaxID=64517 RepID=A0AAD5S7U0_9FUNG|nr:hypothetical protein HK097_000670 [Rhizophlyctis rosea]